MPSPPMPSLSHMNVLPGPVRTPNASSGTRSAQNIRKTFQHIPRVESERMWSERERVPCTPLPDVDQTAPEEDAPKESVCSSSRCACLPGQ